MTNSQNEVSLYGSCEKQQEKSATIFFLECKCFYLIKIILRFNKKEKNSTNPFLLSFPTAERIAIPLPFQKCLACAKGFSIC